MISKLPIGGLKLSPELVQINLAAETASAVIAIFERLAQHRINLTCVTLTTTDPGVMGSCTLTTESWPQAEPLLQNAQARIETIPGVGTLTLFPHQSRLALLECVLSAFGRAGLPIHSIASSLSTLTFCIDYHRIDDALRAIETIARLPDNHMPALPQWRIRQM
jgi:aspartokinase